MALGQRTNTEQLLVQPAPVADDNGIEWSLLWLSIALLIIASAVSVGIWFATERYKQQQHDLFVKLEQSLNTAKQRYHEALNDRALYQEYVESFLRYSNKGVIGQERRLSWLEELQAVNTRLKLPSLNYAINPQRRVELPLENAPEHIAIHQSTMHITAGLLHEGDAIALLRDLRDNADGFYTVRDCELISNYNRQTVVRYHPGLSNVRMDCQLDWYTIMVKPL